MHKHFKIALIALILLGLTGVTFADRGAGKKSKLRTVLNISTNYTLKTSLSSNLKTGLSYKGSILTNNKVTTGNTLITNSLMTYQKGNTTYIIPFRQKTIVSEMKQGYTGVKLILRPKK
ncbi:MAG: hypothetical protein RL172_2750 [Bacteroidota bacterium]|jgi:hypothetical protein